MNPAQPSISFRAERASQKGARTFTRRVLARLSVFFVLVGIATAFVYSNSHASLTERKAQQASPVNHRLALGPLASDVSLSNLAMLEPFQALPITIEENTCSSAQSTFNLNDSVCITVTGSQYIGRRLVVVDPQNLIRDVITIGSSPQVHSYPIPNTATSSLESGFLIENNLGTWHAYIITGRGGKLFGASFVVQDASQPTANVEIHIGQTGGDQITAGATLTYDINLVNYGPDAAANAQFTNPTPSFTTFQSLTVPASPAGITCADPGPNGTGDVICTIPSLPANTSVTFTVQYLVGNVGAGSSISNSTSFTTDTANVSTATSASTDGKTVNTGTPGGCTLSCPANIVVTADTTGPDPNDPNQTVPGAVVSFSTSTDGTCGNVTSSPESGSFFPVGTTPVTSSSSEGGGECSFTVTVTQSGGAVSIACPANVTANADANCSAVVTLGTPTTTGDSVTVVGTRSDGKPMYDCDVNGQNCVRKSQDLPFSAGITSVTWNASNGSGSESCTQTVTVVDVTAPTIVAANQTASADANCQAAVPDFSTIAVVTDNCACASSDTSEICDTRHDIAVTQDVAAGTLVGLGPHTIHLTANDGSDNNNGAGNSTTISVTFTVADTTPPTITAPANVTAYTGAGATTCDTVVTLGTPTTGDNCGPVTVTRSPSGNTFPVGTTTVVWTATDGAGNQTSANQTVTVIDNTVPVITLNGNTPSMWPPDHTLHAFQVTDFVTSVFDNCGGVSVGNVVISQVTSDELDDATGGGDGNTVNDIQIAADCKSVQLRSERAGSGDGRVYTITFRLTDTHGNVTTATARVLVNHDQGGAPETVIDSGEHYTVNGSCP